MGDPEPRDRETIGAGESEPEATVADLGPNGPPDTPGTTLAGEVDPGQATGGVTLAHETSVTATGVGDATHADQADAAPTHRPAPTIAGYEIVGELGRGGMGVVYQARQVRLNRPCALKMILAGAHADPVAAVRFLGRGRGRRQAPAPQHRPDPPHRRGRRPALPRAGVRRRAAAWTERLDGTPWPARRAATLVEALARGVAEAHRLGIVHRDLKPANILLAADGTPKIADFGLAKRLDVESGLTATESILGSPSYMAPEQAEGKAKQVGPLGRRLRAGGDPVRAADRPPAVPGGDGAGDARAGQDGRAGAAVAAGARAAARRRDDRAEVPAEGPGASGTRRPTALAEDLRRFLGRADPGAAGLARPSGCSAGAAGTRSWPACSRAWS